MANFANLKNFQFVTSYFVSDFYIFGTAAPEKWLGQGCRPGILVYFYVQLRVRVVKKFWAKAQKVIFWGGKKSWYIERKSLFSTTTKAWDIVLVSLERAIKTCFKLWETHL